MATLSNQYDHLVQLVAGADEMHALQIGAAVKSGESFNAGSLVSLDSNGQVVKGCAATAMPLFAINGTADLDVDRDAGIMGGGNVNCFVATGGFELFTSEFVAGSYAPNDYLTAGLTSDLGKVKEAGATGYSTTGVVGVVSRGVVADQYNKNVLYFWPVFHPTVSV